MPGEAMAAYLAIFWVLCIAFFVLYAWFRLCKYQRTVMYVEENAGLFFILMGMLLIMAFITHDPMSILGIDVPLELQWLGSLGIFGLSSWQFYLRPLKIKVYGLDREVGEVKVGVRRMEKDVDKLSHEVRRLSDEVGGISKELGTLTAHLLHKGA